MNNKSVEFIKNRINTGIIDYKISESDLYDNETTKILSIKEYFNALTKTKIGERYIVPNCIEHLGVDNIPTAGMPVTVIYNPDAEFDYAVCTSSMHDGTLAFTIDAIREVLLRIYIGETFNKDTAPNNFIKTEYWKDYEIIYECGDMILVSKFDDTKERDYVMIPVKWKCKRIDDCYK